MRTTAPASSDPILLFYRLEGTDSRGRTLAEIWSWDHELLENVHDYIQWLFPLRERSAVNPHAPVLTDVAANAFATDGELEERLKRSLNLMLNFYGLKIVERADGRVSVDQSADFPARSEGWLWPGDHNHLRLTRILTSTRELGLPAYSRALFECLDGIYRQHPGKISAITYAYWRRAGAEAAGN